MTVSSPVFSIFWNPNSNPVPSIAHPSIVDLLVIQTPCMQERVLRRRIKNLRVNHPLPASSSSQSNLMDVFHLKCLYTFLVFPLHSHCYNLHPTFNCLSYHITEKVKTSLLTSLPDAILSTSHSICTAQ